jgi:hypothetical protein
VLLQGFPVCALGHIGADEVALEFIGCLLAELRVEVCDDDLCAFCEEFLGDALAES